MANDILNIIQCTAEETAKRVVEKLNSSLQHNTADPDELISQDEARMMLGGLSSMTLSRWDRAGILRKHHIGKRVAYRRGDIDSLLRKGAGHE